MATFLAANNAVRFDLFNVAGLLVGTPLISNATEFTVGDPNNNTILGGTGFTYSGGLFNRGTINSIEIFTAGQPDFIFQGLSMPVAQFRAFAAAGNSQGFLAAMKATTTFPAAAATTPSMAVRATISCSAASATTSSSFPAATIPFGTSSAPGMRPSRASTVIRSGFRMFSTWMDCSTTSTRQPRTGHPAS